MIFGISVPKFLVFSWYCIGILSTIFLKICLILIFLGKIKLVWYLVSDVAISLVSVWFLFVIFLKMTSLISTVFEPHKPRFHKFSDSISLGSVHRHERSAVAGRLHQPGPGGTRSTLSVPDQGLQEAELPADLCHVDSPGRPPLGCAESAASRPQTARQDAEFLQGERPLGLEWSGVLGRWKGVYGG